MSCAMISNVRDSPIFWRFFSDVIDGFWIIKSLLILPYYIKWNTQFDLSFHSAQYIGRTWLMMTLYGFNIQKCGTLSKFQKMTRRIQHIFLPFKVHSNMKSGMWSKRHNLSFQEKKTASKNIEIEASYD